MRESTRTVALIGGATGVVLALLVSFSVGSPWTTLHRVDAPSVLPPIWFLSLSWFGWFFALGAAGACLLASRRRGAVADAAFWRGMTCLVLAVAFSFVWYILFFGKGSLFFSWLCLPLALAFSLLAGVFWWQSVSKGEALIPFGYALWLLCLFFLQMAVLLHM